MKKRNIVLCIVFYFITFGIYGIYWFVVMTDSVNQETKHPHQTSGIVSFLLCIVTLGIYGWYWAWKMGEKSDILKNRYLEYTSTDTRVLYLVLAILELQIVNFCLIQYEINRAVDLNNGANPEQWRPIN